MRLIKTFVLRFYTDTDHHEQFCGEVQVLPKKKNFPFRNSTELMNLLIRLVGKRSVHDDEVGEQLDELSTFLSEN